VNVATGIAYILIDIREKAIMSWRTSASISDGLGSKAFALISATADWNVTSSAGFTNGTLLAAKS